MSRVPGACVPSSHPAVIAGLQGIGSLSVADAMHAVGLGPVVRGVDRDRVLVLGALFERLQAELGLDRFGHDLLDVRPGEPVRNCDRDRMRLARLVVARLARRGESLLFAPAVADDLLHIRLHLVGERAIRVPDVGLREKLALALDLLEARAHVVEIAPLRESEYGMSLRVHDGVPIVVRDDEALHDLVLDLVVEVLVGQDGRREGVVLELVLGGQARDVRDPRPLLEREVDRDARADEGDEREQEQAPLPALLRLQGVELGAERAEVLLGLLRVELGLLRVELGLAEVLLGLVVGLGLHLLGIGLGLLCVGLDVGLGLRPETDVLLLEESHLSGSVLVGDVHRQGRHLRLLLRLEAIELRLKHQIDLGLDAATNLQHDRHGHSPCDGPRGTVFCSCTIATSFGAVCRRMAKYNYVSYIQSPFYMHRI